MSSGRPTPPSRGRPQAPPSARRLGLGPVTFLNDDARHADLSEGTAFFMYTPFRGAMMEAVLQRVALASPQRDLWVCTFGTCAEQVARQPWLTRVTQRGEGASALAIFRRPALTKGGVNS